MENSVEARRADLEALEERRNTAALMQERYWETVAHYYNKGVVVLAFKVGDLVWKSTSEVMRNLKTPKFTPICEGPYVVVKASDGRYYHLACVSDGFKTRAVNSKYIKQFYPWNGIDDFPFVLFLFRKRCSVFFALMALDNLIIKDRTGSLLLGEFSLF